MPLNELNNLEEGNAVEETGEIIQETEQKLVVSPKPIPKNRFITGSDIGEYCDALVDEYRGNGHVSTLDRIRNGGQEITSDEIMGSIIEEMLEGNEDMLGKQLMFSEEGNLNASISVTAKRSEILKGIADIVAKRKELNQRASDIDLNSPAFLFFQEICFKNLVDAMKDLQIDEEMINLIVQKFIAKMDGWGKELKNRLEQMAQ